MHSPPVDNPHERAGRAVKVVGLILALQRFGEYRKQPVTAAELAEWQPESWELLSVMAGVNPPSPKTQALVIERLRERISNAFSGYPRAVKS